MIVVATNNGKDYLPALLDSFREFGTGGRKVVIMDTGSTCEVSKSYIAAAIGDDWPFELEADSTPYRGYDTGAYIHAYRSRPADDYVFLQDSVMVKHEGWLNEFESRATHGVGCVPWLTFPMQWDNQEEVDWVREKYRTDQWPPFGIFGPFFYARREALDSLDKNGYLDIIPSRKLEQQAMERGWSTAFVLSGWGVRPVETFFDETSLRGDKYRDLTKRFAVRN